MMKNFKSNSSMKIRVTLLALLFCLAACAGPQIHQYQLTALNLGMSADETVFALKQQPKAINVVSVEGEEYIFHRYPMNNGLDRNLYLLAFKQGKLKYWGYFDEFRKHPDKQLNKAAARLLMESPNK